ncbi:MAG: phytase, partial [Pseudomonadota bacterium]|nr:phytase [Pseudomonadota bacterium]
YRLIAPDGKVRGELVRQFKVDSQPEGCVADDQRQRLFIGEEDVGVWAVDARADQPATLTSVIKVGPQLHADVEGVALYQSPTRDYLVISSQGNDSYLLLDAEPPYATRGAFRVGLNADLGIDGASETDGLEVTSMNLGGPWSQGMLVVQDGRKRMPEQTQNFKFVPWAEVSKALQLP